MLYLKFISFYIYEMFKILNLLILYEYLHSGVYGKQCKTKKSSNKNRKNYKIVTNPYKMEFLFFFYDLNI